MVEKSEFKAALNKLYREEPCKILPTAIWKTMEGMNGLSCSCKFTGEDTDRLEAFNEDGLHLFWNRTGKVDPSFYRIMKESKSMILHDEYFQQVKNEGWTETTPYFRVMHDTEAIMPYSLNEPYQIVESKGAEEVEEIADFIGRCYDHLHPSAETVLKWTRHRVYDKKLWIWIMDNDKKTPAALGIAECDTSIPEGSLEWIQVLPEYRDQGLGKTLVLELLNRLKGRVAFATVSGEVDNTTNPERLYRKCGFYGNDVWWVLRKEEN